MKHSKSMSSTLAQLNKQLAAAEERAKNHAGRCNGYEAESFRVKSENEQLKKHIERIADNLQALCNERDALRITVTELALTVARRANLSLHSIENTYGPSPAVEAVRELKRKPGYTMPFAA